MTEAEKNIATNDQTPPAEEAIRELPSHSPFHDVRLTDKTKGLLLGAALVIAGVIVGFAVAQKNTDSTPAQQPPVSAAHSHGDAIEADPASPIPQVSLEVLQDPTGGHNVHVQLADFEIAPQSSGHRHTDGQGHLHLYVDGTKVSRMYGQWYHLSGLQPGDREIRVELSSNDHRPITHRGEPIGASVTITVPQRPEQDTAVQRPGEIHIHDDGTSHTHGAGAPEEWVVVYTSEGEFVPERLEVLAGDTVTWQNESDYGVWPASNIHPSHEIYPEFDPLKDIPPGESWSFKFTKNGTWRYHNHELASETGTIIVTGAPDEPLEPLNIDAEPPRFDPAPPGAGGEKLFDDPDALREFVLLYGPEQAVTDLKATEVRVRRNCHNPAHDVGRIAYEEFGPIAFVIAGHGCQSGALHGAMEALFAQRGTSQLARDVAAVCSASEDAFVLHQCRHGVGHGIMAWTSYELHESLELCDVLPDKFGRDSCYSGVFMENVVGGLSGLMGHETQYLRLDDPHFPCDIVASKYVPGCYFYQTSHMVAVYAGDMEKVAAACSEAPQASQYLCFSSYGRDVAAASVDMPELTVEMCNYAPPEYRTECTNGAVQNIFWEPQGESAAIGLCKIVNAEQVSGCWDTIIDRAQFVWPSVADRERFCAQITDGSAQLRCKQRLLDSAS